MKSENSAKGKETFFLILVLGLIVISILIAILYLRQPFEEMFRQQQQFFDMK